VRASSKEKDSGILVTVPRRPTFILVTLIFAATQIILGQVEAPQTPQAPPAPAQPSTQTPASVPTQPAIPAPAPPPQKTLSTVIIDPAHGGADQGARGASGIAESDVVLGYARLLRISLEAQGFRVILTRQANEDPSFDDRSKQANSLRGDLFISLHVASSGQPGTVRVYSYPATPAAQNTNVSPRSGLISWDRAQFNFTGQSRRLAELIQIQMAQRFRGTSDTPFEAPVRQLRTIAAPAVAIEVSSVSVPSRGPLDQMGFGVADGVARAVAAFRTVYEAGGK